MRHSPIKRPLAQKLSRVGTQLSHVGTKVATHGSALLGSASSAAVHGTQLSSAVASKAGARAAEEMREELLEVNFGNFVLR